MTDIAFSKSGKRTLFLCTLAFVIFAITGCSVSYNAAEEKGITSASAPIVDCSATPTNLMSGSSALISTKAVSPLGLPLTYSYGATAGSLTSQGNSATLNTQGASGNIVVTCKVVDSRGNAASSTATLAVQPTPSAPIPISCQANPPVVPGGGTVDIVTLAISPEDRPLTYSWSASAGTIHGDTGNQATLSTTDVSASSITVICKAADDQGRTASATTVVSLTSGSPPVSAPPTIGCSANPATVTPGGSAVITAVASSPEQRPMTYSWNTTAGSISGRGNTATLNTSGATAGTITVTCRVVDDQGRTASATTAVTVSAGAPVSAPPNISCSANPVTVTQGGSVAITAVASSPEGRPLTYSWNTTAGSISGSGNTATLNTSGAAAGTITVTCRVVDDQGRTASATTVVTVNAGGAPVSAPPTISCSANPSTATQGTNVAISAVASSPEGRPLTYTWNTTAGSISGSGNTATLSTSGAAAGTITVTCKVADDQGRTASATTVVTVNAPASNPPTISCSANPSTVTQGTSATITAVASSPEGRPLTYSWNTTAGSISGSGNTATLSTSGAAAGPITVTCKVADDQGRTASATTAVTINAPASNPPTISCSANPSTVTQGTNATITAVASSPEGRPLTYTWNATAGSISGSGNTATLSTSGAAAGSITVTCKVADDQGRTASATTAVTINAPASNPPTISCSANPSTVTQGTNATITAVASSPEGRPLTYTWNATAGSISGSGNTATLSTSGAAAGTITVTCKVADDQGRTASATTAVTVNAPPATTGNTYYVSPSGSNSNPCTQASPCADPAYAFNNKAAAGDTVRVAAGTYDYGGNEVHLSPSGTSGKYITLTCVTRGACKIQNSVTGNSTVLETDGQYITIDGFEITNTSSSGNNLGIYITMPFVNITRNTIHHIETDCGNLGGGGIQVAGSSSGNTGLGNIVVDSNLIYDISMPNGVPKCNAAANWTDGIIFETAAANNEITNNIIYWTAGGWGILLGNTNAVNVVNNQISNNLIFSNARGGIVVQNGGVVISSNIIVDNGTQTNACGIMTYSSTGPQVFANNDLFNNNGGNYCVDFNTSDNSIHANDLAVDPSLGTTFVNWQVNGSGDYHEKTGSPTIGDGSAAGTPPTHDYDGNPRPGNPGWDIGPYEQQ